MAGIAIGSGDQKAEFFSAREMALGFSVAFARVLKLWPIGGKDQGFVSRYNAF